MRSIVQILSLTLVALMVGCGDSSPPEADGDPSCTPLEGEVSNLQQTLRATGLWKTDSTNLAPPGALQRADNAVLRDDGFLEPVRGFTGDVDFGTTVDALYPWTVDGQLWLIAHGTNNTLYRRVEHVGVSLARSGAEVDVTLAGHGLSDGDKVALFDSPNLTTFPLGTKTVTVQDADNFSWTESGSASGTGTGKVATVAAYSGTYIPPTGNPMRFWEAGEGGNLFFTTSEGPYRLDTPTSTPVLAGSPKGLEGKATVTNPATGGWLNYGETVGYRANWGRRTEDGRLILGAPSGRMLLTNTVQDATPVSMTWTRSSTTATVTKATHGLSVGNAVVLTASSDTTALPLGVYTVVSVPTTGTYTITVPNAGATSGTGYYVGNDDGVRNGSCTTYIPTGIQEGVDFCQLNRTVNTTTSGVDPGEDMALVAERFPTASEIAAKSLTFEDIAPFANGANAYFSPSEGLGGIDASLNQAPLVEDGIVFREYAIVVGDQSRRAVDVSLLAIGDRDGLNTFDGLKLNQNGTTELYLAGLVTDEGVASGGGRIFGRYTTGTTAENLENTVRSLVRVINQYSMYWMAEYASADTDPPGRIVISERNIFPVASKIRAFRNQRAWAPTFLVEMKGDFTRVGSTVTVDIFAATGSQHHLHVDDKIIVTTGATNFPAGVKTVSSTPDAYTFTYVETGTADGPTLLDFTNDTPDIELESTVLQNSWMFSAAGEWDGFPPINERALGGPTNTLSRVLQFGQSVIFFSDEGIWHMNGTDPSSFTLFPYSSGGEYVRLVAPNTVAKIPQGAFALTETGVTGVDEQSFNPNVGQPISLVLRPFISGSDALKAATKANAFAVGNDIEGEYWLFLPDETATSPQCPTQAYIYSTKAGGWTRYVGNIRTGVYSRADQRMYFAPTTSGPILRERRDKAPTDFYAPNNTSGVSFGVEYVPFKGTAPTAEKQWVKAVLSVENSSTIPMPQQVGMWFSTSNDAHSTWWGNQHTAHGDGIYATYSPLEVCRGAELGVKIEHSTGGEWLRIKDVAITYNQASELRRGR